MGQALKSLLSPSGEWGQFDIRKEGQAESISEGVGITFWTMIQGRSSTGLESSMDPNL